MLAYCRTLFHYFISYRYPGKTAHDRAILFLERQNNSNKKKKKAIGSMRLLNIQ